MIESDYRERGGLIVPDNAAGELVFPGVRGKVKQRIKNKNGEVLFRKGERVIIRPLNLGKPGEPVRYKITPYKEVAAENDLPESQRNTAIDHKKTRSIIVHGGNLFSFSERYQLVGDAALFPDGSPKLADINQANIPDCFYLASIAAILNAEGGDAFIRQMMRQNSDGTTTVRFYNPVTQSWIYVPVQTAYIIEGKDSLSNHQGLWVDILETAIAAAPRLFGKSNASVSDVLNGGSLKNALEVLTGRQIERAAVSNVLNFNTTFSKLIKRENKQFEEYSREEVGAGKITERKEFFESIIKNSPTFRQGIPPVLTDIFGEKAQEKLIKLLWTYKIHQEKWDQLYAATSLDENNLIELIAYLGSIPVESEVQEIIEQIRQHYYRKDAYSPHEENIYTLLHSAYDRNEAITASTKESFETPGLRNRHAYTVIDVYEKGEPAVKYVRLRNPWGNVGRAYVLDENNQRQAIEDESGEFDLELKDFCTYFNYLAITENFSVDAHFEQKREEQYEIITGILRNTATRDSALVAEYIASADSCFALYIDRMGSLDTLMSGALKTIFDVNLDEYSPDERKHHLDDSVDTHFRALSSHFHLSDKAMIKTLVHYYVAARQNKNEEMNALRNQFHRQLIAEFPCNNTRGFQVINKYYKIAEMLDKAINITDSMIDSYAVVSQSVSNENEDEESRHKLDILPHLLNRYIKKIKENYKAMGVENALYSSRIQMLENRLTEARGEVVAVCDEEAPDMQDFDRMNLVDASRYTIEQIGAIEHQVKDPHGKHSVLFDRVKRVIDDILKWIGLLEYNHYNRAAESERKYSQSSMGFFSKSAAQAQRPDNDDEATLTNLHEPSSGA